MKSLLRRVEASQGVYESAGAHGAKPWPDPIRRGLAGDGEAAREIAALLDDSDVTFRRKAAELLFDLKRKEAAPELRLALSRDEDDIVRRFSALALTRLGIERKPVEVLLGGGLLQTADGALVVGVTFVGVTGAGAAVEPQPARRLRINACDRDFTVIGASLSAPSENIDRAPNVEGSRGARPLEPKLLKPAASHSEDAVV